MINIYKHISKKNTYIIGDIHGKFLLLRDLIEMRDFLTNCVLIVAGDCGFGFHSQEYYDKILTELNMTLLKNDVHLYFVRGNHDDPSYFINEKIKYSNIVAISDYSIIQISNENILCVGGGISIDRLFRQERDNAQREMYKSVGMLDNFYPSYWEDELPIDDYEKLKEITDNNIKIDYVISHTSPSFCCKVGFKGIESWLSNDINLLVDLQTERSIMDNIYSNLLNLGHNIKKWVYGHFHVHNDEIIEGVRFITLEHIERGGDIHHLNPN